MTKRVGMNRAKPMAVSGGSGAWPLHFTALPAEGCRPAGAHMPRFGQRLLRESLRVWIVHQLQHSTARCSTAQRIAVVCAMLPHSTLVTLQHAAAPLTA